MEEDRINKPWRPLPIGRISLRSALLLRWIFPLVCCALSMSHSKEVIYASIAYQILTYLYNELHLADIHWAFKNITNCLGYGSSEVGACLIAGRNIHSLDTTAWLSVLCSIFIVATTVHIQDFKDVVGDKAIGRHTLAIEHPTLARQTFMTILMVWSIALSFIWGLSISLACAHTMLGALVGWRFISKRDIKSSTQIWLSIAHFMPAYFQFIASRS